MLRGIQIAAIYSCFLSACACLHYIRHESTRTKHIVTPLRSTSSHFFYGILLLQCPPWYICLQSCLLFAFKELRIKKKKQYQLKTQLQYLLITKQRQSCYPSLWWIIYSCSIATRHYRCRLLCQQAILWTAFYLYEKKPESGKRLFTMGTLQAVASKCCYFSFFVRFFSSFFSFFISSHTQTKFEHILEKKWTKI